MKRFTATFQNTMLICIALLLFGIYKELGSIGHSLEQPKGMGAKVNISGVKASYGLNLGKDVPTVYLDDHSNRQAVPVVIINDSDYTWPRE